SALTFGVSHRYTNLGSGAHTITVIALWTKSSRSSGTRVGVDAFTSAGVLHRDPPGSSGTWADVPNAQASNGNYVVSDVTGASASLSFMGTGVTFTSVTGPGFGKA